MNQDFPLALSYDDVLLIPNYSDIDSRSEVDLTTQVSPNLTLKIPLITTKMDSVTGVEMAIKMSQLGGLGILPRFDTPQQQADKVEKVVKAKQQVAAAVGVKDGYEDRAKMLVKAGACGINIDVAHGHMQQSIDATKKLKSLFGDKITIISGIASTYECGVDLYKAGADSVLVGIGASPICTTRIKTGCGLPGFASLLEVSRASKNFKGKTCMPDAGMRESGDIVKALAAGACGIVGGYLFSGTDEAPGKIVKMGGKKYKSYNGSASRKEKVRQIERYQFGKSKAYAIHVEGVESLVSYKGPVEGVVESLLAGIKSGLAYCGARNISELQKKAKFARVTNSGHTESQARGIVST